MSGASAVSVVEPPASAQGFFCKQAHYHGNPTLGTLAWGKRELFNASAAIPPSLGIAGAKIERPALLPEQTLHCRILRRQAKGRSKAGNNRKSSVKKVQDQYPQLLPQSRMQIADRRNHVG